jgi:hypothetical protein
MVLENPILYLELPCMVSLDRLPLKIRAVAVLIAKLPNKRSEPSFRIRDAFVLQGVACSG